MTGTTRDVGSRGRRLRGRRWQGRTARTLAGVGLAVLGLVVGQQPALAAQHSGGSVAVYWSMPGASGHLWNIDQIVWVEKKAPYTYWAMQFGLSGTADNGYMGLQTNAVRPDGTTGDMAIFSLWNADKTRNGTCKAFAGEGNGLSCRANYSVSVNVRYRYRVWRLDADATGQWWGAWILNTSTNKETYLGDIHVRSTTLTPPLNFTEYWGTAVACSKVPQSIVDWTQPAGNYSGSSTTGYQYYSSYSSYSLNTCIVATVTPKDYGWTKGARVVAGSV